jgi:hypothetical protein
VSIPFRPTSAIDISYLCRYPVFMATKYHQKNRAKCLRLSEPARDLLKMLAEKLTERNKGVRKVTQTEVVETAIRELADNRGVTI